MRSSLVSVAPCSVSVLAALSLLAAPARAQDPLPPTAGSPATVVDEAPAHISLVDGVAILERDGESDDSPVNMPLLSGDRVRTRAGRVEILFADGATLHLDHNTTIDLQSDELVRLIEGRIRLSIPGPARDLAYRIDGPQGWATIAEPGDYRLATMNGPRGREIELVVLRGRAELANEGGQTPLRAGERAFVRAGEAPSFPYVANSAAWDAFDRWSEARRDERLRANAEYLPDEVRPYAATLEAHGDWRTEPTYGAVWYPRVQPEWRPYYRGRWVSLRPYGWTWVGHDPWGWPTHHYGRWGWSGSAWFWIPGRTWGAAWVSWASAPGYVSWCPLGWDNRPILQINIGFGRSYDPWRAWTVIPRHHFGHRYVHVTRYVVRGDRLDHGIRRAFTHGRAPVYTGRAVPRGSAPIRVAGSRSRRDGTPLFTNVAPERARSSSSGPRITVPSGARPNPDTASRASRAADGRAPGSAVTRRAVPRERTVPDRPAVRSERARPSDARRADVAPEANAPSRPSRSVVPRTQSTDERRSSPAIRRSTPDRGAPTASEPPRRSEAPSYSRPRPEPERSRSSITRTPEPAPSAPRAVPRREYSRPQPDAPRPSAPSARPSREHRAAPPVERRGPEPRSSGSYERRGDSRPSGPAASGARQRPSGQQGPGGGRAVRRPSGGQ